MTNSAPAVVGASDGLAAFRSIIAKKGTRSCLGAGCGAAVAWWPIDLPHVIASVIRHGEELLLVVPHPGQLAVRPPLPEIEKEHTAARRDRELDFSN